MRRRTNCHTALSAQGDIAALARREIAILLPTGEPRICTVASSIGLSPRTLQRLLGKRGLSFSDLVGDVRLGMAYRYLDQSNVKLSKIAHALGYSDAAHFTRAFRRWTGKTPSDYRQGRRHGERNA